MRNLILSILSLLLLSLLVQCSQKTASLPLVNPPIPELDVPYEVFTFEASQGGVFRLPTGTQITIPSDALVDTAGHAVTGEVTLKFREIHDKSEVFRSGITMRYDSAETQGQFETAGMFEIAAFQAETPLQLRPGAKAQVDLATYDPAEDYSFYYLDQEQGGWAFQQRSQADTNYRKRQLLDSLDAIDLAPFGKEYFSFDYRFLLDVYFGHKRETIKKYKESRYVRRKIDAYGPQYFEGLYPPRALYTRIGDQPPLIFWLWRFDQPERLPRWVEPYKVNMDVTRINAGTYRLILKKRDDPNTTWARNIYPIMPIKRMYAHTPADWRKNFTQYLKNVQNSVSEQLQHLDRAIQQAELQADFIRSVKIDGFGIYNYDRLRKSPSKVMLTARFQHPDGSFLEGEQTIWLIPQEENSVIQWAMRDGEVADVYLTPAMPLRICVVSLETQQMHIFDEAAFAQIDFEQLRQDEAYTFRLKPHPQPIHSYEDIRAALGMPPAQPEMEGEKPLL